MNANMGSLETSASVEAGVGVEAIGDSGRSISFLCSYKRATRDEAVVARRTTWTTRPEPLNTAKWKLKLGFLTMSLDSGKF